MSASLAAAAPSPLRYRDSLIAAFIIGVAVLGGLTVGDRSPEWWIPLGIIAVIGTLYLSARWPFMSLLLILGSSILLVVVRVSGLRSVNLIDILMPPALLMSYFGQARLQARAHPEAGPLHARLRRAESAFTRSVVAFHALAAVSLFQLARLAGAPAALDSALLLVRAVQGLLLYPLCMWWLHTPERISQAWRAIVLAGLMLGVVNLIGVTAWDVKRAGMTLFLNNPDAPFSTPNEAGTATLVVAVVLIIRQLMRPDWKNLALGALMVVTTGLTQSRSGLLAWVTFGLLTLRWVKPSRLVAGAITIGALLPLMPHSFWIRMTRTLTVERGSFEFYSFFQRVIGWLTAWRVFEDHPWTGVGYLGFRFVSHRYNDLRIVFGTVENYYYETLISMGVIGLTVLVIVLVRLFQLGHEIQKLAAPGTLAHHMARFHTPLVLALLVANMTGDNLTGMVGIAQLAMWTAVLVRSGHEARPRTGARDPSRTGVHSASGSGRGWPVPGLPVHGSAPVARGRAHGRALLRPHCILAALHTRRRHSQDVGPDQTHPSVPRTAPLRSPLRHRLRAPRTLAARGRMAAGDPARVPTALGVRHG